MADATLNRAAASATLHCLTGCAVGEVVGMIVSTAWSWGTVSSLVLSIVLAFVFGYSFSIRPLVGHGLSLRRAMRIAFAADTASITVMELADNAFILVVPGAIHANLDTALFWTSLVISLAVAFAAAYPINRHLIARGKGHAVAHSHMHGHHHE